MSAHNIGALNSRPHDSLDAVDGADAVTLHAIASQHLKAANALGAFDGVVLPQMFNAALSMELYLKALAIHAGVAMADRVTWRLETLSQALQLLPEHLSRRLASGFARQYGGALDEQLAKFSKAFAQILHHHQMPDFYEGFDLHEFMQLARFFGEMGLPAEAE